MPSKENTEKCGITPRLRLIAVMLLMIILLKSLNTAEAHFFGGITKDLADGYQVLFVSFPTTPKVGDNSTKLFFSILNDGDNIDNVDVALTVKEKNSGQVVAQVPYAFYEFSDVVIPFTFQKVTTYDVILETRVNGDSKYQYNPLIADFDVKISDANDIYSNDTVMLGVILAVAAVAMGAGVVLIRHRNVSNSRVDSK